jgi:hypothetical protein
MERYIVSCYAAEDEAHFRAHRDNTTKATADRRFAVSRRINTRPFEHSPPLSNVDRFCADG